MIKKYRKKPVVIEAIKWDGKISTYEDEILNLNSSREIVIGKDNCLYINTLEGTMKAEVGDYIIKGVKGELYPCKPDIFEKTYEEVSDEKTD